MKVGGLLDTMVTDRSTVTAASTSSVQPTVTVYTLTVEKDRAELARNHRQKSGQRQIWSVGGRKKPIPVKFSVW